MEFQFDHIEKYDYVENIAKYNDFVAICLQSTVAFRHFYKITANTMIEHNFEPTIQNYLNQFISDVKIRQNTIENFHRMYDDDLYNYVKIVDEMNCDNSKSREYQIAIDMLQNLRDKSFCRFVVVVTHFKKFSFLLVNNNRQ